MFVSFRKCSPPQKPDPISDRNCQNLYPISDQNGSKTIPFGAAHTYIPYIGEYPSRGTLVAITKLANPGLTSTKTSPMFRKTALRLQYLESKDTTHGVENQNKYIYPLALY